MRIPKYWAEHKQRFQAVREGSDNKRQVTIKRYGWSDSSQAAALAHAKTRVSDAYQRWQAGADIVRRERDQEYHAKNGIPIREPILFEQTWQHTTGDRLSKNHDSDTRLMVTRNRYGAQVANVNNIAIVDVDNADLLIQRYPNIYDTQRATGIMGSAGAADSPSAIKKQMWFMVVVAIALASIIAVQSLSWLWLLGYLFISVAILWRQASKEEAEQQQRQQAHLDSLQPYMTERLQQYVKEQPTACLRLYQTPAGFRIIVMHDTFLPSDNAVTALFQHLHADSNYVRLCQAQYCFRARLTAKPWRMAEVTQTGELDKTPPASPQWLAHDANNNSDMDDHADNRQARAQWLSAYDTFAIRYRACRYIDTLYGQDAKSDTPETIAQFVDWHDKACRVMTDLPLA